MGGAGREGGEAQTGSGPGRGLLAEREKLLVGEPRVRGSGLPQMQRDTIQAT